MLPDNTLLCSGCSVALYAAGSPVLALILAGVTAVHYAVSHDRIAWLLGR